jgi:centromere/kinetochore protein ZW10
MQISNDALWIGSETLRSWSRVAGPSRPDVEIESAVEMMRREGQRERERQVGIQRKGLMEILDESKGFLYTGKDDRFAACERAMRQVTYTLERLAKVWKVSPTSLSLMDGY